MHFSWAYDGMLGAFQHIFASVATSAPTYVTVALSDTVEVRQRQRQQAALRS